jgi:hypothetical protein
MSNGGSYLGGSSVFHIYSAWTGKENPQRQKQESPSLELLEERVQHLQKFGTPAQLKAAEKVLAVAKQQKNGEA